MSERPNAFFSGEVLSKIKPIGPWSDCPIGTKAFHKAGGYWIKAERGWTWLVDGPIFGAPGDGVFMVVLP